MMAAMGSEKEYEVSQAAFPAKTRTETSTIQGKETVATSVYFADKILITICQDGKLAHWVCV